MFGEIAERCGRRAERSDTYSDRADRLQPNIAFSKRDSYQRRGHLTVSKVESYRLTLPRSSTKQGWPRTAREVVRRARARRVAPREPARSMAHITRRARVSPAAATARSLRRRRYVLIRVHPLLYRYQTLVSEIAFLLFLELINHQKFHTKVSSRHPKAPQPRRPTTNRARFRTQCATGTNEWLGMVRNRRGTGKL